MPTIETISQAPVTLIESVTPLIDFLNLTYPSNGDGPHTGAKTYAVDDSRGGPPSDSGIDQILIGLCIDPAIDSAATSAIVTLLWKSGPDPVYSDDGIMISPFASPLHFALEKQTIAMHGKWQTFFFLSIGCWEGDTPAAADQIDLLVQYLNNKDNLVDVGPEERAIFGIYTKCNGVCQPERRQELTT